MHNDLVCDNLRFAYQLARSYIRPHLEYDDLCAIAVVGLCEAARRFDTSRGLSFCTYAKPWVRKRLQAAVDERINAIAIPGYINGRVKAMRQQFRRLMTDNGRWPTIEQLMAAARLTYSEAMVLIRLIQPMDSLDRPISATTTLSDLVTAAEDRNQRRKEDREVVAWALSKLPNADAAMVRMKFGLDGFAEHSYAEIAEVFGLGKQRCYRRILRSLQQLKTPELEEMRYDILA